MGFLPKNIFSKKTAQPAVEEIPLQEEKIKNLVKKLKTKSPKTLLRGPNGKFINKASLQQTKDADKEAIKQQDADQQSSSRLETATINNFQIRHFKVDGQCFFCVEDIIESTGVTDTVDYIKTLKEKEELRKVWKQTSEVEIEKEDKNELLEFATVEDIKAISSQMETSIPDSVWQFLNKTSIQ